MVKNVAIVCLSVYLSGVRNRCIGSHPDLARRGWPWRWRTDDDPPILGQVLAHRYFVLADGNADPSQCETVSCVTPCSIWRVKQADATQTSGWRPVKMPIVTPLTPMLPTPGVTMKIGRGEKWCSVVWLVGSS